jgi:membrane fusion protein, heavy metal efflux system
VEKRIALSLAAVATAAAATGLGVGSLVWREGPSSKASAEEHEEEGHSEAEEEEAGDFVPLPASEASAAGVETVTVSRGGGSELLLPGRVVFAPNAEATVGAQLPGVVESVHVALGTRVGAGGPLVTLRSAEGASLNASADAARADAAAAAAALRREQRLFSERVTARQDLEAAQTAAVKADANLRATRAQVAALGSPGAGGHFTIRSPIAGTVTSLGAAPGGFLSQGAAVAQIADQSRIEVIFDAPAAVSRSIRSGNAVFASGAAGEEIRTIVTAVSPNPANAGAQVRAKPVGYAPPVGTPISGRVLTAGAAFLVVPTEAVQTVEGRPVVFVAEANGFRVRPVVRGRMAAGRTEILRGLAEGERVAGRGAFLLKAELSKSEAEHEH